MFSDRSSLGKDGNKNRNNVRIVPRTAHNTLISCPLGHENEVENE